MDFEPSQGFRRGSQLLGSATAALVAFTCCACGTNNTTPGSYCGHTLYSGQEIPLVVDVASGDKEIGLRSADDIVYLRVSSTCDSGASMQFQPDRAAAVLREVDAADGKPFAIEIKAARSSFVLQLTHADGSRNNVTFESRQSGSTSRTPPS